MDWIVEIIGRTKDGDTEYIVLLDGEEFAYITRTAGPEEDCYNVGNKLIPPHPSAWFLNGTFRQCVLEVYRRASFN